MVPEEWGLRLSPAQLSLAKFGTELANFNALRPWINVAKGSKSDQNNTLLNKSDQRKVPKQNFKFAQRNSNKLNKLFHV